ncbi:MAG TPA: hypothetical protein VH814_23105 [Steroidobacteraceae bacterium]|jgi:hypothetical protein
MRTALLASTLMVVAAMAWAGDEPSAPEQKAPQQKTEAAADTAAKQAEQARAADDTKTASAVAPQEDDQVPFKPPAGYRPKRINGEQVWCAKQVVLGSRFAKDDCRNEAELREMIRNKESMRTDMDQRLKTCTSKAGCSWN